MCSRTTASSRCRAASAIPIAKGKSKPGVGHAQKTPLRGLRFETLEEAQAYLDRWETRWADTRIHGTTKRQVAAMFAEEQPALGPLPLEPFRYYRYGERTVHLDGCVEVEAAYYGAPPGWIGQRVHVQWNDLHVRLLAPKTGQLLREHLRAPRGWHRLARRRSPGADATADASRCSRAPQTRRRRTSAPSARTSTSTKAPPASAASSACSPSRRNTARRSSMTPRKRRSSSACPTYRFLRRYLERRLPAPLTLRQVDPLIRQLTLYRDLIDRTTGDPL